MPDLPRSRSATPVISPAPPGPSAAALDRPGRDRLQPRQRRARGRRFARRASTSSGPRAAARLPAAREILDRLDRGGAAPAAGTGRGTAARPGFGATLTEASYEEIGLKGLAVGAVDASGAAARAGIQTGDLLLRADGRPLAKSQDLLDLVRSAKRGQVVAIDLLRAGRPLRVSVRLD